MNGVSSVRILSCGLESRGRHTYLLDEKLVLPIAIGTSPHFTLKYLIKSSK